MSNLLADGFAWLEGQRHSHVSSPVVYRRGASSVALNATAGKRMYEVDDGAGGSIAFESRDYLIRAEDLILSSVLTLPAMGDTIEETAGATTFTYQVLSPGVVPGSNSASEPHWRYSDDGRLTLRIHTKLVGN